MTKDQMKSLLTMLIDSDAALVDLSIGYIDDHNTVKRDAIVIRDAAPVTVKAVMAWTNTTSAQQDGPLPVMVSVHHGGLFVY